MVLETQQWLNNNYGNVPGFNKVKEDGKTGWPTIYALIRALQHELGITELSDNFGTDTSNRFDTKIVPKFEIGYKSNVVRLIQYAFWCKGINPVQSGGEVTEYTLKAIKKLQSDAGFTNGDSKFDSTWAKALFDMSAFVLVSGGDKTIRGMQQWLNVNYKEYFGILPCDGIYQRATNTALIYALQSEEGLAPESEATAGQPFANGNYGDKEEDYFTSYQGYKDAFIASKAARDLGFPEGATIYFAVDVDLQEGDIDATTGQYMIGVINGLAATEYSPGIYGTRNVCLHGEKLGMKYSFVSKMSYGWSGNLGYKMPDNWAFDQFIEYPIGGTPIDQGASSGKDNGHNQFETSTIPTISAKDALDSIASSDIFNGKLTLDKSVVIIDEPYLKFTISAAAKFKKEGNGPSFNIKNGNYVSNNDSTSLKDFLTKEFHLPSVGADLVVDQFGKYSLSSEYTAGNMSFKLSSSSDGIIKISATYNVQKAKQKALSEELSMTMEVVVNPLTFVNEKVSGLGEAALEFAKQILEGVAVGIAVVIIVGITTVSAPADAIALATAFIFTLITKSITG